MRNRAGDKRASVPGAARAFARLEADEALTPSGASTLRRCGALLFILFILGAVPLLYAASAAGLIGEDPAAIAKSGNSGPGNDDDDDSSGAGGDDDDDTGTHTRTGARGVTDDTSANGHSTRGTTNDHDTHTKLGTDDTSRNGHSTRGTTDDNDTHTGTRGQTRTRTSP